MTLHRYITVTKDVYSNRYPWVVKFFWSCKSQSFIFKQTLSVFLGHYQPVVPQQHLRLITIGKITLYNVQRIQILMDQIDNVFRERLHDVWRECDNEALCAHCTALPRRYKSGIIQSGIIQAGQLNKNNLKCTRLCLCITSCLFIYLLNKNLTGGI